MSTLSSTLRITPDVSYTAIGVEGVGNVPPALRHLLLIVSHLIESDRQVVQGGLETEVAAVAAATMQPVSDTVNFASLTSGNNTSLATIPSRNVSQRQQQCLQLK